MPGDRKGLSSGRREMEGEWDPVWTRSDKQREGREGGTTVRGKAILGSNGIVDCFRKEGREGSPPIRKRYGNMENRRE